MRKLLLSFTIIFVFSALSLQAQLTIEKAAQIEINALDCIKGTYYDIEIDAVCTTPNTPCQTIPLSFKTRIYKGESKTLNFNYLSYDLYFVEADIKITSDYYKSYPFYLFLSDFDNSNNWVSDAAYVMECRYISPFAGLAICKAKAKKYVFDLYLQNSVGH